MGVGEMPIEAYRVTISGISAPVVAYGMHAVRSIEKQQRKYGTEVSFERAPELDGGKFDKVSLKEIPPSPSEFTRLLRRSRGLDGGSKS
jgi:hypothetical protein